MKKTVMIIDDQPAVRKLLSHYLGHFYNVIEKSCASDATEFLDRGEWADVIIADVMMPEMTGIEFLEDSKKRFGKSMPPVMMLSSVENSTEKLKCFSNGAQDYLVKPFNPEELRMRLDNLLIKNI